MPTEGLDILDWAAAIGAALGVIGVWTLGGGLWRLLRGRVFSGSLRSLAGGLLCALVALGASIGLNLYTYQRLGAERAVADIHFHALAPQRYQALLSTPDGDQRRVELDGDQWQLDARVIKWSGLARLAGFDTLYRLERISGRYRNVGSERSQPRTVIALTDARGLDAWRMTVRLSRFLPGFDADYGSATYLPMADDAAYHVSLSASGLVARPANAAARQALADW